MAFIIKNLLNHIFILFFIFPLIRNLPQNGDLIKTYWDEHSLFDYIKQKYLNPENPEELKNLHYILADPNEYLKNINLDEIKNNLEILYKELNVTTFIYIVRAVEKNTDLNYKLKDFVSEVFSELYKKNPNFDEYSTISAIFRVEDKKLHIRLGSTSRNILYDSEALQIIKKRKNDLEDKKFEKLLRLFTKDLLSTYKKNFKLSKNYKGYFTLKKSIIVLFCFVLTMFICAICYYIFCNKENLEKIKDNSIEIDLNEKKEKKIEEFIKNNKNKDIEKIIEEICILCLENYEKENDIKISIKTSNSDEEETNNDIINNINEKINLPCGHYFHLKCISEWFKLEKKCPICMAEYEFYENEEKGNESKLNIKNYKLNENWKNENNILIRNIDNFIKIQKMINPFDINEEIIKNNIVYNNNKKNDIFKSVKIDN